MLSSRIHDTITILNVFLFLQPGRTDARTRTRRHSNTCPSSSRTESNIQVEHVELAAKPKFIRLAGKWFDFIWNVLTLICALLNKANTKKRNEAICYVQYLATRETAILVDMAILDKFFRSLSKAIAPLGKCKQNYKSLRYMFNLFCAHVWKPEYFSHTDKPRQIFLYFPK